jgi:hypothetical protein
MAANFAPGEDDWMRMIMGNQGRGPMLPPSAQPMPPQTMQAPQPQLGGQPPPTGLRGLLGNRDLALALLANSGYGPKQSFGQVLGKSALMADQMGQQRQEDAFKQQYMQAQMQHLQQQQTATPFGAISPDKFTRESIAKFEQTGKYSDLVQQPQQREAIDSAQIRNYQFRAGLKTPEEQRQFDDIMRQNYDVVESGGVQNVVRRGSTPSMMPLNSLANEVAAGAAKKGAEAQASAIGTGQGGIIADITKKGANAKTITGVLDIADPLIDASTGSLVGAGVDKLAGVFGQAPQGAEAAAQLQVLQAGLMLNQPRMEGPQSDADVKLYRAAAGQIGDPTVPAPIKKAAVKTIRLLQQRYAQRAADVANPENKADPLGIR